MSSLVRLFLNLSKVVVSSEYFHLWVLWRKWSREDVPFTAILHDAVGTDFTIVFSSPRRVTACRKLSATFLSLPGQLPGWACRRSSGPLFHLLLLKVSRENLNSCGSRSTPIPKLFWLKDQNNPALWSQRPKMASLSPVSSDKDWLGLFSWAKLAIHFGLWQPLVWYMDLATSCLSDSKDRVDWVSCWHESQT